ncbi:MAG: zinc ribbon domain-containing protein [Candidatus Nanopelagicales bacterium]
MSRPSCQCCLMPLAADPGPRTSELYCSLCFQDGRLNADEASLGEFQRRAYLGMRQRGVNPVTARFFTFTVRFAPYWKARAAGKPAG